MIVVLGCIQKDGTVTFERDKVQAFIRDVISTWENSAEFIRKVDREYDNLPRQS